MSRFSLVAQFVGNMLFYFAYAIVAHRGFYPRGFGSLLRTLAAFTSSVVLFMLSVLREAPPGASEEHGCQRRPTRHR